MESHFIHNLVKSEVPPLAQEISDAVLSILRNTFKLPCLRESQNLCTSAVIQNYDVLFISPTGSGKSLVYQLPGMCGRWTGSRFEAGVTIILTPLLSLMKDQVGKMKQLGIEAVHLDSTTSRSAVLQCYDNVLSENPSLKFIYMTPERFVRQDTVNALVEIAERHRLCRIVVDECHCVTMWGDQFRKEYMRIGPVVQQLRTAGPTSIIALTATATARNILRIQKYLMLTESVTIINSFLRHNLKFEVRHKTNKDRKAAAVLVNYYCKLYPAGCGIVYCMTRKEAEAVHRVLVSQYPHVSSVVYHAGLSTALRDEAQRTWMMGEAQVIVATVALGMGVDKENVRFVIHQSMSLSMEAYYQETGRAGRDGHLAHCILLANVTDYEQGRRLIEEDKRARIVRDQAVHDIKKMWEYCMSIRCRRELILKYFGEVICATKDCQEKPSRCDNCEQDRHQDSLFSVDITEVARAAICVVRHGLYYNEGNPTLRVKNIVGILKGSPSEKGNLHDSCRAVGFCSSIPLDALNRLVEQLIVDDILEQHLYIENVLNAQSKLLVKLGKKAKTVLKGEKKAVILLRDVKQNVAKDRQTNYLAQLMKAGLIIDDGSIFRYSEIDNPNLSAIYESLKTTPLFSELTKRKIATDMQIKNLVYSLPRTEADIRHALGKRLQKDWCCTLLSSVSLYLSKSDSIELLKMREEVQWEELNGNDVDIWEGVLIL